jgi:hypothetical protein
MSASPKPAFSEETLRGTLRIVKEGYGAVSVYDVTFCGAPQAVGSPQPLRMANSDALVQLLDRLRIDFRRPEVRQAIEDLLLHRSCYIPERIFTRKELQEAGLA